MKGPHWIKQWIADLAALNDQFRDDCGTIDFEALGREEYAFRTALITRNLAKSERARDIYNIAKAAYNASVENGKKGGRPRKDTTADGDTREDSLNVTDGSNAALLESGTSANLYGEAATSDGAEAATCRESGAAEPTTFSKNIGNDQGTEAPRRQRRAGADSVRGTPLHSAPARSPARKFRNKEEFIQWAIDAGLDPLDAGECWDATLERGGKDADGNVVKNIKAFTKRWCKTRDLNRRSA